MAEKSAKAMKNAVALAYREGDGAPKVLAKGRGLMAEAIIERARAHGIYVHESPELVSLLLQIDLDQRIPPQLYVAVAELLAWLYRLENHREAGTAPYFSGVENPPENQGQQASDVPPLRNLN